MNLDPDGYWFNAQNGAPQDASELKALLGCNGTLKIVETTDNFLYCRYVCSKCSFDSWHTMSTTAHKNHDLPGPQGPYAYNGGLCECN